MVVARADRDMGNQWLNIGDRIEQS